MKSLNLKHIILIGIIGVISLFLISAKNTQTQNSNKEILLVEIYVIRNTPGMFIFHNDKPTERLDLDLISKKTVEPNGQVIKSKFQELYEQGWELEGMNGGDQIQRYILTK